LQSRTSMLNLVRHLVASHSQVLVSLTCCPTSQSPSRQSNQQVG
jgi:hypothetical protein